jgi:hypothetical protein
MCSVLLQGKNVSLQLVESLELSPVVGIPYDDFSNRITSDEVVIVVKL